VFQSSLRDQALFVLCEKNPEAEYYMEITRNVIISAEFKKASDGTELYSNRTFICGSALLRWVL